MEDLRKKLQYELSKQDVQLDRLDREKQEESNLVAMLQVDIERLNSDRYVCLLSYSSSRGARWPGG